MPTRRPASLAAAAAAAVVIAVAGLGAGGCGVKDRSRITIAVDEASLTIDQADGVRHQLTMAKDGTLAFDGETVAKVAKNGRLSREGRNILLLVKGGHVLAHGQPTNVLIGEDASFTLDGRVELSFGPDGAVTGPLLDEIDHPRFEAEGAHLTYRGPDPVRRAMMLGVVGFVAYGPGVPLSR